MPERRMDSWNRCKAVLLLLACALLTACGGGGGTEGRANADSDDGTVAGLLAAPITEAQAVRFLWKSSFGPTTESIARLQQLGYARFVDEQLAMPTGHFNTYMLGNFGTFSESGLRGYCNSNFPNENINTCLTWIQHGNRAPSIIFFQSALQDSDQLRLRVMWALSQILVVSTNFETRTGYGIRIYQQMLRDNAFGNYRNLLYKVSKNPVMGEWLDLVNSDKALPNQNYARELLQLFSVGTYARHSDGQFQYTSNGSRIENYTQTDIIEFSKALTGWRYSGSEFNFSSEMVSYAPSHDTTEKKLLRGARVPASSQPETALAAVLDNVMEHPSTAPNIVRQLIQFLVTSHPSPAYVARVVKVWNSDSSGVRGNLKSVIRAILLDQESLNPPDNSGRLLEPVIAITGLLRAIGGVSDGAFLDLAAASMNQRPLSAPSVFNFYSPDYSLPTSTVRMHAPQFGIVTTPSVLARVDAMHKLIFSDLIAKEIGLPLGITRGTKINWPPEWISLAGMNLIRLIEILNTRLIGGNLDALSRSYIQSVVSVLPSGTDEERLARLRKAVFLMLASPQFMTHR